ncbi:zinc transporter ZitB [Anaplasma phagocytophilum str. MRK]|uniref:cation diffusion facilitator family transporter n=1 Tax=Anaplasma phagocytophilum TaxID=948 RepID=UPI0005339B2F|nr:cation diffusion facilitator family transporter [Anaplasma phagocytophilum]KDB55258.1 zinc transporter ZitB [Anaplasma phagocytophilum str. MRK]
MTSCDSQYSPSMHRRMVMAIVVVACTLVVETIGGFVSHSLVLLSDAGHVFIDLVALILSFAAYRLATKEADEQRSYGYHRFQVMAAFVNGISWFVIAALIVIESIKRFVNPVEVHGHLMLPVAVVGFAANIFVFCMMYRKGEHNLNIRSAVLHVIGDLLCSVAAIASSIIIRFSGWQIIDPMLSLLVSTVMLISAFSIVKNSSNILLEGKPYNIDVGELQRNITSAIPNVIDVHHVHLWSLTAEYPIMTMHVRIACGSSDVASSVQVVKSIKKLLQEKFSISHVTIEIEHEECSDAN